MGVATAIKRWTLEELHRLPDDGNRYELVAGDLFVTPPPSHAHQEIIARLLATLVPYVQRQGLGLVHTPRSVIRHGDSEVEPDAFVSAAAPNVGNDWQNAPTPILVVEVLSDATRRRDLGQKRQFYMEDMQVAEYWAIDPESRLGRVMRPGKADVIITDRLTWHPAGAGAALIIELAAQFPDASAQR